MLLQLFSRLLSIDCGPLLRDRRVQTQANSIT